ncbi:hypothetical protein [Lysinibacillus xylanilyticus]|uniref:hypothetical protein n=1 Tax=Lysinibacillus xylanilyticus TaxID=582475 RepID=UPI0036D80CA2
MASKRFILLINNMIIRDDFNNPIFEVQENGKKFYSNGKGDNELEEHVENVIAKTMRLEEDNELLEVVSGTQLLTRYNQDFKIKMFITPLYELQLQLVRNPKAMRIAGSDLDVQAVWQDQLYNFYVLEFVKYTQIIDYLELMVRIKRPKESAFRVRAGENRIMNVLHVEVNGLFNPLEAIAGLGDTKLFKKIYGKDDATTFSIDDPAVFQVEIMSGAVTCFFATSTDIMKLCNVNHKEPISSRDAYRLIAGICLKNTFSSGGKEGLHPGVLSFPINQVLYQIIDGADGSPVRYFNDPASARAFADEVEGYKMQNLDIDAMYISSAFPSFKNKNITTETDLLHQIRGAEFVY